MISVIARRGPRERIVALLEDGGCSFELLDSAHELAGRRGSPAVAILFVEGRLSATVGGDIEMLRQKEPQIRVLVVCSEIRPGELRGAIAAGAAGVVLDAQLASTLGPSLAAVQVGQVCVPVQDARQIEPAALSAREKQILGLVVMGYMNSQIADQLFVAESTVKSHLSSAFAKLGVRSRNEAVDVILDPDRGLGMGILALGGEPVEAVAVSTT